VLLSIGWKSPMALSASAPTGWYCPRPARPGQKAWFLPA